MTTVFEIYLSLDIRETCSTQSEFSTYVIEEYIHMKIFTNNRAVLLLFAFPYLRCFTKKKNIALFI